MDNSYQDDTDPSVYVKFKLADEDKHLLAWTTTPWTLPSNSAIAINNDITYADVRLEDDVVVIAEDLIEKVLTDEKHQPVEYEILKTYKGSELVGKKYQPLFEPEGLLKTHENAFKIWHADFVHAEDGTGIAHESPAYGEEDYDLSKANDFPWIMSTDESGYFTIGEWKGENIWEVNKRIAKELKERRIVWKIDYITHQYPHCHRCNTKLMYRAHPSWFMDIDGQRKDMLEQNEAINWFPKHIKNGRSQKTIESAPDWNLSRDRFWATPMPVWKGTDSAGNEQIKIVGSYKELEELSGKTLEDYHRPWVDDITFEISGVEYKRIEKVMDCWFESGSMPFAQHHYPFENKDKFENSFPADFIVEYVPQVRAWFYYMEAVNVGLFGKAAFQNAIVHGTIAGSDGRKMSKSFGNYTDPNELMDQFSADSLRYVLLSSPLLNGEDFSLQDKDVGDVARKLSMIWNMYDFFTLYADVDGWEWDGSLEDPSELLSNPLDTWIVSRVHQLNETVDEHMHNYDIPNAMKPLLEFLDDASNWYVRRSRKRFWKSENDSDKNEAYKTLHYLLVQVSIIFAPFTPFLSEELYQKLTGGESVHLLDWPKAGKIDNELIETMSKVRSYITEGLAIRAKQSLKVRQPLASVTVPKLPDAYSDVIIEELNVKKVIWSEEKSDGENNVILDLELTDELRSEGIMRDVIRQVQNFRKSSELEVDDRIVLGLGTEDKSVSEAVEAHAKEIMAETLADSLNIETDYEHTVTKKVSGVELKISLQKA
jgi:isoleucyl-tRNA synthetase